MVPERAAHIEDVAFQDFRLDERIGPQRIEEFVRRHQPAGVLDQVPQDSERLRRQPDTVVTSGFQVPPQALVDGVQPEWIKFLHVLRAFKDTATALRRIGHSVGVRESVHDMTSPSRWTSWLLIPLSLALAAYAGVPAAAQAFYGSINGRISDETAAIVIGASVTVTSLTTGERRTDTTDATGSYRIVNLHS